ncbi:MAG: UpxY family transcription antiterminator [Dysgonamonadaceae bacterium]|jgi:transcription antitermination factor NusG|nr:UpxY family transcription antiterminator [Dysgonamonadaceae bacterium]
MTANKSDIVWYAARVKFHTEKKLKKFLEESGIEHFIPFHDVVYERLGKRITMKMPVIPTYIFVRTDKRTAFSLPEKVFTNINFVYRAGSKELLVIPEKQMQDFIIAIDFSEGAIFINNGALKRGDRVRVIKGPMSGLEGELVRMKGHKRVVIRLEGILSMAMTFIPMCFLEKIEVD